MLTEKSVRRMVANSIVFARGQNYEQIGRVQDMTWKQNRDSVHVEGTVRGSRDAYLVFAEVDERADKLRLSFCNCPAFERYSGVCKHVAALLLAYCKKFQWKEDEERFLAQERRRTERERERRMRLLQEEQERAETERRQRMEMERQEREHFLNALMAKSASRRLERMTQERPTQKVRIYPQLCYSGAWNYAMLELKIGSVRTYVVRNVWEFAARIRDEETVTYGKALSFSHTEQEVSEEDIFFFRHITLLAHCAQRVGVQMRLGGAVLDQTMRLLLGREVFVRWEDGNITGGRVLEGEVPVALALEQKEEGGAKLRIGADSVLAGSQGAYLFSAEGVTCAFGAAYDRIDALLETRRRYPDGVLLEQTQIAPFCAQVIAPAGASAQVVQGQQILSEHIPMPMTARFYVDVRDEDSISCRVEYDYGVEKLAPGAQNAHIRRDELLETVVLDAVLRAFPQQVAKDEFAFAGDDEARFSLLADRLPALRCCGEVLISDRLAQMNVSARRAITFGIKNHGTQLLVQADIGNMSRPEMEQVLGAYREKRRFVRLRDGTFLSDDALEQAAQVAELAQSLDVTVQELAQGAKIPLSRGPYLQAALGERQDMRLDVSAKLGEFMDRLGRAQRVQAQAPRALNASLRPYQLTGLSWLCALSDAGFGGILADDMGLGKTVQALSLLLREKERGERVCALVVCPASLQLNWRSEAARFVPTLSCAALLGGAKARREQLANRDIELTITSYEQLRRDGDTYADIEFTHVLLDEAQVIKNAASKSAKAVKALRAAHRFAMTGTPIENRLSELWSIFDFLMPGYLYSYKAFKQRFELPIVKEGDAAKMKSLRQMVAPFILRRMKKEVLKDLPEKVETVMTSELTAQQRRVYSAHAARLLGEAEEGKGGAAWRMKMLAGLTRLRQICCDPRLCLEGYTGGSGKLEQVMALMEQLMEDGHRVLVFSQFTTMLALIAQSLNAKGVTPFVLTGGTEKAERMRLVEAFNAGEGRVFLISLKAGGTGLNLTGADVVIHYDPWWNTAAQNQATDRAYRIGQTRGVQVFYLIAADTIEERILLLQQEKRALSDDVLSGEETLFTLDAGALKEILQA